MSAVYCHFCESWSFSNVCRTEERRDRCREYRDHQEAVRLNESAKVVASEHRGAAPQSAAVENQADGNVGRSPTVTSKEPL